MTAVSRLIEPIDFRIDADVVVPGSKSITNRALVCAALADGESLLDGLLIADDTEAMIAGLVKLGVGIEVDRAACRARVVGSAGRFQATDVRVDARLSGTTSRFLLAASALSSGSVTIDGSAPLRARPMIDVVEPLRQLGAIVTTTDDRLPIQVTAARSFGSDVSVGGAASSQFLSGLLMIGPCLARGLRITVVGALRSGPYIDMTVEVMRRFGATVTVGPDRRSFVVAPGGYRGCRFSVEPDASAASYFFAAAASCGGRVAVDGLGTTSLQGDLRFVEVLRRMGAEVAMTSDRTEVVGSGNLVGVDVDMAEISDTAQTLAAVAPFASGPTTISGIGFTRRKETDRIGAVVTELTRCGVVAGELDDGLRVEPGVPHGARVETYHDHRMAMSFALIGLRVPGIEILDPDCVAKTFPDYWTTLEQLRRTR